MRAFSLKSTAASYLLWLVVAFEVSRQVVAFLNLWQVVSLWTLSCCLMVEPDYCNRELAELLQLKDTKVSCINVSKFFSLYQNWKLELGVMKFVF